MPNRLVRFTVNATADTSAIRTEQFNDRDHLVVPVVALVEGVIQASNAPAPELALAEEFARFPSGWDGRPTVMNHPKVNGSAASANSPAILEAQSFGQLFNTKLDEGKLKTEAWIDLEKVTNLDDDDINDTIKRLQAGKFVEVSTGLFANVEEVEGSFDGDHFSGVWRDVIPDHLAFLTEGVKGACSVEDGCGAPRLNQAVQDIPECGAQIRTNSKVIACSRDGCPCDGKCLTEVETAAASTTELEVRQPLAARLAEAGIFRDAAENISDIDIRRALLAALDKEQFGYYEMVAVFDSSFVYAEGFSTTLTERSYEIADGGAISLGGEKVAVRPVTEFVPVALVTNEKESQMQTAEQKVDALIANKGTKWTEDDKKFLLGLEEDQLDKVVPVEEPPSKGADVGEPVVEPEGTPAKQAADGTSNASSNTPDPDQVNPVENQSPEDYIHGAPSEMQEVLNEGLRMQRARKSELIKALTGNDRCAFTEIELAAKTIPELEKLAQLANLPDYSGAAPLVNAAEDDTRAPEPPQVFPFKQAG